MARIWPHVTLFLVFIQPILATASASDVQPQVQEWSVVKSVPLVVRDYVRLIHDFSVCHGYSNGDSDNNLHYSRPLEGLVEIVDVLMGRTVPQILGVMEIIDKTGGIPLKRDPEENNKSWYVLKRLAEISARLRTLVVDETVYGRATKFGDELTDRFHKRFAFLNDTLSDHGRELVRLTLESYEGDFVSGHVFATQLERKQDWVAKEAAWNLLEFLNAIVVPYSQLDVCLQRPESEECGGVTLPLLLALLEDELIPFLRTVHGVAWTQTSPHRHKKYRDTFPGWFMHAMTSVLDFERSGVGRAHAELETAIFKLQRLADALRPHQRESAAHLVERYHALQHAGAQAIQKGIEELELHTVYMDQKLTQEHLRKDSLPLDPKQEPGRGPRFVFFSPNTLSSMQMALSESADMLANWSSPARWNRASEDGAK
ncbi:hypothetical protein PG997_010161 [Apiospora hydei]|uniref:Uncharacterized protein n=1 Tax=Apiospora hydei TaxID=1337664 RepID=A0ABR1W061_9PEZI